MAKRASKAELVKRREEVSDMILEGVKKSTICDVLSVKWKTSKRAISEDIRELGAQWKEAEEGNRNENKNKNLARLEMLFNMALDKGQIKTALEIQKDINKLQSLYEIVHAENETPKFITLKKRESNVIPLDEKKAENE